eukprot:scaffold1554_cov261-Pinguiococcus_pyrenoidosus.AAC.4
MSLAPEAPEPIPFVRPSYKDRVSVSQMKEVIKAVLEEKLAGKEYESHAAPFDLVVKQPLEASKQTRAIVDEIRQRLQEFPQMRYKFMVQAVIGMGLAVRVLHRIRLDGSPPRRATWRWLSDGEPLLLGCRYRPVRNGAASDR